MDPTLPNHLLCCNSTRWVQTLPTTREKLPLKPHLNLTTLSESVKTQLTEPNQDYTFKAPALVTNMYEFSSWTKTSSPYGASLAMVVVVVLKRLTSYSLKDGNTSVLIKAGSAASNVAGTAIRASNAVGSTTVDAGEPSSVLGSRASPRTCNRDHPNGWQVRRNEASATRRTPRTRGQEHFPPPSHRSSVWDTVSPEGRDQAGEGFPLSNAPPPWKDRRRSTKRENQIWRHTSP